MAYEIKLKTGRRQPTLSVREVIPMEAIPRKIGEFLGAVGAHLRAHGGRMAGPPFTRYHGISEDSVELEAGAPVDPELPGEGRVRPGHTPAGEVATTVHVGPYEGLPEAGAALLAWCESHGRQPAGPNWEFYVTDPGDQKDPTRWRTEVQTPLEPAGSGD